MNWLHLPSEKMPTFCAVYGCSNRSDRERGQPFFRIPQVVVHKGEKCEKLKLNKAMKSGF